MSRNPFRLKQVSVRLRAERPLLSERPVRTPEDAAKLVKDLIADFDREAVCIVNLRNDLCPINFSLCSIGTLTASVAEPREMIKAMCLSNSNAFLMIHNHPGGSLSPSTQDVEITDRMGRLGSLLHIPLVDHLIVIPGSNRYFSFKNQGILEFEEPKMKTEYKEIIIPDIMAAEPPEVREKEQLPDMIFESCEEITEGITTEEFLDTVSGSCKEDEDLDYEESPSFCLS